MGAPEKVVARESYSTVRVQPRIRRSRVVSTSKRKSINRFAHRARRICELAEADNQRVSEQQQARALLDGNARYPCRDGARDLEQQAQREPLEGPDFLRFQIGLQRRVHDGKQLHQQPPLGQRSGQACRDDPGGATAARAS
jgi:hypothetical protein